MDSSDLRIIIALLFAAFILVLVIGDLTKRRKAKPSPARKARARGFERAKPPAAPAQPARTWKAEARPTNRSNPARMSPRR